MTITDRTSLKAYFETGDRPTQSQFGDLIDSFVSMGISDTNTGSLNFSGCLSISGSISASVATFSSSVLVSGSLIAAGAACIAGSAQIASGLFIGTITSHAFVKRGLVIAGCGTIGGAFDHDIAVTNASVAHGMTTWTTTDTYLYFAPVNGSGGVSFNGWSGASTPGIAYSGINSGSDQTRSTAAIGTFQLSSWIKNGTSIAAPAANVNIAVIRSGGNAKFIFDSDGDLHADAAVTASSYDSHDDIGLVRSLEVERVPNLRQEFGKWARYNKEELERLRIATFNDGRPGRDNDGSVFVNYTALARLHSGAIWQLAQKISDLEKKLLPSGCNYIDLLDTG